MKSGLVADTGGLLRALACHQDGTPAWPDYTAALTQASAIIVPALVLAEIDYFLRQERPAMRKLIAEILDPGTTYELEAVIPTDLVRAMVVHPQLEHILFLIGNTPANRQEFLLPIPRE